MAAKKIILEKDGNLLRIGGKWYRFTVNEDGDLRTGTHVLEEVDKGRIDKQIKDITTKLFHFVDPKLVLCDALKDLGDGELEKLHRYVMRNKDRHKIKAAFKKHCILMKVGGVEIPLR